MTRPYRIVLITLAIVSLCFASALWLLFPWGPIRGLVVEQSRYIDATQRLSESQPSRIALIFSTPTPLDVLRVDRGAGFINATLTACKNGDLSNSEVVTQRAGYFPDRGRVRALPITADGTTSRHRYEVIFDDPRTPMETKQRRDPASRRDELCFFLDGGSMWAGKLWSDTIRLPDSSSMPRKL